MTEAHESELLPRHLIFANPERSVVRLSPDGTRIAFRAPVNGVLNLWVAPLGDVTKAQPVTDVADRNLGPWILWMHDNRHIVFFREQGGDENWRAWRIDLRTGDIRSLTQGPGVTCYIQQDSPHFPSELLIGHNERDKRYFDIWRVNVATGDSALLHVNDGFVGYFSDRQLNVRFAARQADNGDLDYLQRGPNGDWNPVTHIAAEDTSGVRPVEFSDDGSELYWLDSRGRDTAAVVVQNMESGALRVLAEDPRADFTDLLLDPVAQRPIAARNVVERARWHVLDPEYKADFDYLTRLLPGDLFVTGISQDRRSWIAAYAFDDAPLEYFHYDRDKRQVRRLFSSAPAWENVGFTKMESVVVRARDGLELVCYLSRPRNAPSGERLPMVLLVHGGPWARDHWGLIPDHQWLASRGYAVLSVNYRGSTGFGKAFVNAGNFEWAGKMHDDLIDAVDWAIAEGIADAGRIAIMGASYGGYATLVGLTFTPEKFACAVDIVGISNLVTFLDTIPDYWVTWKSEWKVRLADYTTEAGRRFLEERSPLNHVHRIVRPLLIGQGANDVRVKAAESEQIVAAMQRQGIPVTYVFYPDEGHGFGRPENRRSFAAVAEAFLATHLGGRCQPVGDDFEGSTIEFKAGRDLVPGLDDEA
ncbi:S9 family peptidase [Taklimakanibacter deserti]|uniref:S9 family peptidase n=1 Tax=Taklimakanibacter deserti TaxID=2267839 RepID=UPI000E64F092